MRHDIVDVRAPDRGVKAPLVRANRDVGPAVICVERCHRANPGVEAGVVDDREDFGLAGVGERMGQAQRPHIIAVGRHVRVNDQTLRRTLLLVLVPNRAICRCALIVDCQQTATVLLVVPMLVLVLAAVWWLRHGESGGLGVGHHLVFDYFGFFYPRVKPGVLNTGFRHTIGVQAPTREKKKQRRLRHKTGAGRRGADKSARKRGNQAEAQGTMASLQNLGALRCIQWSLST